MIVVMILACAPGPQGPQGLPGQPGLRGPEGAPGQDGLPGRVQYRWYDLNDNPVTDGPELVRFDVNGVLWAIDPSDGSAVVTAVLPAPDPDQEHFESVDCTGEPLMLINAAPMVAVQIERVGRRYRPVDRVLRVANSMTYGDACHPSPLWGLRVDDYLPLTSPPPLSDIGPLHPAP